MNTEQEEMFMRSINICKFIPNAEPDKLETRCFIYESNPEVMQSVHILSSHRAFLVKQGTGNFSFDGELCPASAGCLLFGFAGERFYVSEPSCEYMYIDFAGLRAERFLTRFSLHKHNRVFTGFDGVVPFWQDSLTRATDQSIDLAAESMLLYVFSRLSGSSAQNDLVMQITEITEQDFTNPALSISVIAEELSYNPKYLSHLFKEKTGVGYTEYLRNTRLKYAVSLLNHGIDSVKNIAFLSGFSDPLYFSNVFKKAFGMSPKEYRKSSANSDKE